MAVTSLKKCDECGGDLVRVPRTFLERIFHSRVFACVDCGHRRTQGTWLAMEKSEWAVCPSCGTSKLSELKELDPIERVYRSLKNSFNRMFGGHLLLCRFCRLQFYDLRDVQVQRKKPPRELQFQSRERFF